jgi:exodeoxyribonuclease VII small subunit
MSQDFKPVEELSFREGMAELDEIVKGLEGGQLELEDSLSQYERGVQLISNLQKRLGDAQQKVEELMGRISNSEDDEVRDTTLS